MSKVFQVTVRDSGNVYKTLESFRFEIETMTSLYGLPADIEDIREVESGDARSSPPGGPHFPSTPRLDTDHFTHVEIRDEEPSEFHDVSGSNV